MWAFISNEYRTICYTQRQLNFMCEVYTYPTFKKVSNLLEAKQFFASKNREFINAGIKQYGKESDIGYISIEYFVDGTNIYVNVFTKNFGFIKLTGLPPNVKQDASYDLLKLKICNVILDDTLISHHCVAISNILRLFDTYINIELILPDISVYLACTKYKGKNYTIRNLQGLLNSRMGNTFYTIK